MRECRAAIIVTSLGIAPPGQQQFHHFSVIPLPGIQQGSEPFLVPDFYLSSLFNQRLDD